MNRINRELLYTQKQNEREAEKLMEGFQSVQSEKSYTDSLANQYLDRRRFEGQMSVLRNKMNGKLNVNFLNQIQAKEHFKPNPQEAVWDKSNQLLGNMKQNQLNTMKLHVAQELDETQEQKYEKELWKNIDHRFKMNIGMVKYSRDQLEYQ